MRRLWLLVAVAGCIEPDLLPCPGTDLLCGPGTSCDTLHRTCVTDEQLRACVGVPDDKPCVIGVNGTAGYCRDQICLPITCGNGLVDLSEACDDGNAVSADGCNSTCSSTEQCGNGAIDEIGDEACDDGNLIDADGCDSRCQPEEFTWSYRGVSLRGEGTGYMVYDEARHEMLFFTLGLLWSYDGTRWSLLDTTGPLASGQITYDPDRGRVVLIFEKTSGTLDGIWEWDGTAWSERTAGTAPVGNYKWRIAYDRSRNQLVLVTATQFGAEVSTLGPQATSWTKIATPTTATNTGVFALAVDEARDVVVFNEGTNTYEWAGTSWTKTTTTPPAAITSNVLFDPVEGAVIALNQTTVMKWTGTVWTALAAQAFPDSRSNPAVAWDPDRQRRVVFGGTSQYGAELSSDSYEWTGSAWAHVARLDAPFLGNLFYPAYGFAYDPEGKRLIQVGGTTGASMIDAWALDEAGDWRQLPESPMVAGASNNNYNSMAIAYDPVRHGIVANTITAGTFLLSGNTWSVIEPTGTSAVAGMYAMIYDPTQRALIGVDASTTWMLRSDAQSWTSLGPAPGGGSSRSTLAFDGRSGHVIAQAYYSVHELVDGGWQPWLSPGPGFQMVANPARGSVLFVAFGNEPRLWERLAGGLQELAGPPVGLFPVYVSNAYGLPDGTMRVLIMASQSARVMLEYRSVGTGVRDACAGGDDDGDGLVDCADEDCWVTCAPVCPPYASCAP